ncbi:MAG: hypothetical protein BWX99_01175 [Deltaproteobacteria bacterium ADurb.Bin151]|nr:MAG: hypothetical protein BWX99_01175 [Deltaproteobacteria bacterium ADurb.Bin151]
MNKTLKEQLKQFAPSLGYNVKEDYKNITNTHFKPKIQIHRRYISLIESKIGPMLTLTQNRQNNKQYRDEIAVDNISDFLTFVRESRQKGGISDVDGYIFLSIVENLKDFSSDEVREYHHALSSTEKRIDVLINAQKLCEDDIEDYRRRSEIIEILKEYIRMQLPIMEVQKEENTRKQKEQERYLCLSKNVFSGIDVDAKISVTPVLDEDDFTLAIGWLNEKLKNEIKNRVNVVLEKFGEDYEVGRVLSARAAEKAAKIFYQRCGFQVEDVSINQIKENTDDEWKYFDLKVNNCPVDIKNSRRAISSPERYVEHCVPKFKIALDNENVKIAGVLSNYLWPSALLTPANTEKNTSLLFLGETTEHEHKKLKEEFNSEHFRIDFGRPGRNANFFFPPWIFNYPSDLYKSRNEAIDELTQQGEMEHILSQAKDVNLIPLCIVTNVNLTKYWHNESLKTWEWAFYQKLLNRICANGLSLPFLYLTFLSHFTEMLSSHSEQYKDYRPDQYRRFVFMNTDEYNKPLGIYDPLYTVRSLIEVLDKLWSADHNLIRKYKYFRLSGFHIFQGKISPNDNWETIIAYCGGRIEGKGKCGKYPLVLGESNRCPVCKKLICPKCGFCSEECQISKGINISQDDKYMGAMNSNENIDDYKIPF